ncbi:MAG TPA: hypothetical protein VG674_01690 [Amycolatopsis sp.]|nr:hypothetical protein [Amycolatopsis sp.]
MPEDDLVRHVAGMLSVSPEHARKVIADILDYFNETVESYVRRRHAECQLCGMRNEEIFTLLQGELGARLVAAPQLSLRQLRRMIYG